jgi:hypothetical protein
MAGQMNTGRERSNAYSIFILVLTVLSLVIMAALVLPLGESTVQLLTVYDNVICVVFLIDFLLNLSRSRPRSDYFIRGRGWLDLLGSIPSFGFFRYTALLRLARLSAWQGSRGSCAARTSGSYSRTLLRTVGNMLHSSRYCWRSWCSLSRACLCSSSSADRQAQTSLPGVMRSGGLS